MGPQGFLMIVGSFVGWVFALPVIHLHITDKEHIPISGIPYSLYVSGMFFWVAGYCISLLITWIESRGGANLIWPLFLSIYSQLPIGVILIILSKIIAKQANKSNLYHSQSRTATLVFFSGIILMGIPFLVERLL